MVLKHNWKMLIMRNSSQPLKPLHTIVSYIIGLYRLLCPSRGSIGLIFLLNGLLEELIFL